jgi:hypothetical protein
MDFSGRTVRTSKSWKFLGNHLINTQSNDGSDIIDIIPEIVISSYNGGTTPVEHNTQEVDVEEEEILY